MTTYPRVLTIAGSDSGGGAGIQADLKTFTVLGTYGTSVITAVTAQNTHQVTGVYPMTAEQVDAQLDAVLTDIETDVVKTGMLVNADIVQTVARRLAKHIGDNSRGGPRSVDLVVDPVMIAKSGDPLLEAASVTALQKQLLPLATVVTPNIPEAAALTGLKVHSRDDMIAAGRRLLAFGVRAALITGGHLSGDQADDVLVTADEVRWFPATKIYTPNTHGTGCTLSAAIAAGLAHGLHLVEAVQQAKEYITTAIAKAPDIGSGSGPTNHLAWLKRPQTNVPKRQPPGAPLEEWLALYVIVDGKTPLNLVEQLLDAGVGSIQLRDKKLSRGEQVHVARQLQNICRAKDALFIVNDHVDVALAVGADGVHIGQDDLPLREARLLLGPDALIGVTVKTVSEAKAAAAAGADYVGVGPIYHSLTKPGRAPLGPEAIVRIRESVSIPQVAISGIGPGRAAPVIEAGAAGVAVISSVLAADDPVKMAATLYEEVQTSKQNRFMLRR